MPGLVRNTWIKKATKKINKIRIMRHVEQMIHLQALVFVKDLIKASNENAIGQRRKTIIVQDVTTAKQLIFKKYLKGSSHGTSSNESDSEVDTVEDDEDE